MIDNGFIKTVDLVHRALDVSTLRQSVIADNLANAETPNFKRSDLNFESELKRALDSQERRPVLEMARTNPRHIGAPEPLDWRKVEPRRVLDYITTAKNNGNNVDAEQEFMNAVENSLRYMMLANAENFEFSQISLVLRS
jgi:flagellar basal-body rod protein FlgB